MISLINWKRSELGRREDSGGWYHHGLSDSSLWQRAKWVLEGRCQEHSAEGTGGSAEGRDVLQMVLTKEVLEESMPSSGAQVEACSYKGCAPLSL